MTERLSSTFLHSRVWSMYTTNVLGRQTASLAAVRASLLNCTRNRFYSNYSDGNFRIIKRSELLKSRNAATDGDEFVAVDSNAESSSQSVNNPLTSSVSPLPQGSSSSSSAAATSLLPNTSSSIPTSNITDANTGIGSSDTLEAPTTCCQSGCANCVWIDYAEKLSARYSDGGKEAVAAIHRDVDDPNLREYILFELRMKKL